MGRRTIQALVINSSNFNRFNVERIKQTKKRINNKERGKIEKRKQRSKLQFRSAANIVIAKRRSRKKQKEKQENYSIQQKLFQKEQEIELQIEQPILNHLLYQLARTMIKKKEIKDRSSEFH